jgi:N-methylhydantoinase A
MVAFGGAGPLHAVEIARDLHIPTVIVPRLPGHFSALGMLLADLRHDFVQTYYKEMSECDFTVLREFFAKMIADGESLLAAEGVALKEMRFEPFMDMRYVGQEFPIRTPVSLTDLEKGDGQALRGAFDRLHDRRFGQQAVAEPVEVVNLRLTAIGRRERLEFPDLGQASSEEPVARRKMVLRHADRPIECAVYRREALAPGEVIQGPAAISEYASTTLLFEGDVLTVAPKGELIIRVGSGGNAE